MNSISFIMIFSSEHFSIHFIANVLFVYFLNYHLCWSLQKFVLCCCIFHPLRCFNFLSLVYAFFFTFFLQMEKTKQDRINVYLHCVFVLCSTILNTFIATRANNNDRLKHKIDWQQFSFFFFFLHFITVKNNFKTRSF